MRLGSVGRLEESNRLDLNSNADCCVCGKEVLIFIYFDREVTVADWDPEGATKSLRIVPAALGYTITETGQTVLLTVHRGTFSPTLNHNLLSTMKMRLHDVVVNETPKFQCFKPTDLSHSINARGGDVEDVFITPLELHGVVSCLPMFKPSKEEFDTCSRYELTFETPDYDPSAYTFRDQEAGMMDSWGRLKVSGDLNPKRRQVCSLRQKEFEIKQLTVKYSDNSTKMQDLSIVLDDSTLLAQLNYHANIPYFNVSC
jgi:hypothetical protein